MTGRQSSAGPDIAAARRVLLMEANGLAALAAGLTDSFDRAIDLLLGVSGSNPGLSSGVRGRVIVSGMGKSGHVGRKIAATLASTGTPAFFVHPAEASHGDLGMVMQGDVLLCLSNSGDVPEMADLIAHAKRFGIPLIGITSKSRSALGLASDVALILPPVEEACPMGLAPTTSTTMTLALGDALAVALMERKGFNHDHYRVFHPGGRLGKQLIKVSDLMHGGPEMPLVAAGTPMRQALVTMAGRSFGCIGIVGTKGREKGRLVGIVTDGDLRRHIEGDLLSQTVDAVMTKSPITIGPHQLAVEALRLMNSRRITAFFVVDGNHPVGILHMHDCVRAGIT
ncbi:SIS domain-containing protein [Ferrovibrio sp.]|uniref:KpsF/GutQ family sugar-phosphate isomerase n=1 Tax=Ferrovibrio sp. TaxID=1917215 RepID=UPI00345B8631